MPDTSRLLEQKWHTVTVFTLLSPSNSFPSNKKNVKKIGRIDWFNWHPSLKFVVLNNSLKHLFFFKLNFPSPNGLFRIFHSMWFDGKVHRGSGSSIGYNCKKLYHTVNNRLLYHVKLKQNVRADQRRWTKEIRGDERLAILNELGWTHTHRKKQRNRRRINKI